MHDDVQRLLRGAYTDSTVWVSDRIEPKLRSIGKNLYQRVLPRNLRDVFDELGETGELSLLIESDESFVPWELLHISGAQPGFLALRFSLARWFNQPTPPRSSFQLQRILAIEAGQIQDPEIPNEWGLELPRTRAELAIVESLKVAHSNLAIDALFDASLEQVLESLGRGGYQAVHFAGHSNLPSQHPDGAFLELDGGRLEAQDLIGDLAVELRSDRPLVFLNSCHSGAQGDATTGIGGWPQRFVAICGCGGFLGPQWAIRSRSAFRFARSFYSNLSGGLVIGEAVRRARCVSASTGSSDLQSGTTHLDPSLLAYSFYGHPNAKVCFEERAAISDRNEQSKDPASIRPERIRAELPFLRPPRDEYQPETMKRRPEGRASGDSRQCEQPTSVLPTKVSFTSRDLSGDFSRNLGTINIGGSVIEAPPRAEQLAEERRVFLEDGLSALQARNFSRALHLFEVLESRGGLPGLLYFRALALLAGRRPRILAISTAREVENLLEAALNEGEGSHACLLLAYLKTDFHRAKGMAEGSPTIADLLTAFRRLPSDRQRLEELRNLTPIGEFVRRVTKGDQ